MSAETLLGVLVLFVISFIVFSQSNGLRSQERTARMRRLNSGSLHGQTEEEEDDDDLTVPDCGAISTSFPPPPPPPVD